MDGWPAGLFVHIIICTISSVCRQFHVRWNHIVCPSTVPGGTVTERDKREIIMQIRGSGLSEVTLPKEYRSAALRLWEGLSHSASLRSIVIVLKCHSALLHSIVIVLKCHSASLRSVVIGLKVVAAKTNDSNYNFCF
jgi:hypothetical protein